MRVLTNIASTVLGCILLVGTIGIANADNDSSADFKVSTTKNSSENSKNGAGGSKGNGGGTTGAIKNPAADSIQITKPNCSSTGTTQDMAIEGRRAFMRLNCYSCHGMGGHGAGMGPSLIGKASEMDAVTGGEEGGMPSFKKSLCTNDIKNLSAYVALLGTASEPTFTHWWENGRPSR